MDNNLINHEVVDSFYMTDEQMAKYNDKRSVEKRRKAIKRILLGFASGITLGALSPLIVALGVPALASIVPAMAGGVVFLSGILKLATADFHPEDYGVQDKKEGKTK